MMWACRLLIASILVALRPGLALLAPSHSYTQSFVLGTHKRLTRLSVATTSFETDRHIPINFDYPGLRAIHRNPDVFLVDDFLTNVECDDLTVQASAKGMALSPVAYAGWTEDLKVLVRLVPALVLPLVYQLLSMGVSRPLVAIISLAAWAVVVYTLTTVGAAWADKRGGELQALRTSTSTVLPGFGIGDRALVTKSELLMRSSWRTFEAPTVIRYEAGQALAPHFDAIQGDAREEKGEMGQTLATLLVYLNDVPSGGITRFGLLESAGGGGAPLEVNPTKGQGLLFFPASADGKFDGRLEHEGRAALDEKWIARIWRHEGRVVPPYGLPNNFGDE
mmetsp:Transcript_24169/g.48204  ORF Transcript_24169/g.48204 Transcript_24169/m.48204 type:complete len:336 (+) Transcript_24169:58-1065(+)